MASNRRPSKDERQRRNRAARDARTARSANAGEATELHGSRDRDTGEAHGGDADATTEAPRRGSGRAAPKSAKAGAAGRAAARRSRYDKPGQRAVVLAFLFTIASVVLLIISPVRLERETTPDDPVLETADDVEIDEDEGVATYVEEVKLLDEETLPVALAVLLVPVAITGAAAYFSKHEKRSTIWTMSMLALAAYVFFIGGAYSIYTLPALVALGVGGFQARRDDNKERMAELKAQRAARKEAKARGEVIDVDAVEEPGDGSDTVEEADDDRRR